MAQTLISCIPDSTLAVGSSWCFRQALASMHSCRGQRRVSCREAHTRSQMSTSCDPAQTGCIPHRKLSLKVSLIFTSLARHPDLH